MESSSSRSQADDPLTAAISCLPCRVTSSRFTPPLQTPNILCVDLWDVCQRLFSPRCPRAKRVRSGVAPLRATFTQRVRSFFIRTRSCDRKATLNKNNAGSQPPLLHIAAAEPEQRLSLRLSKRAKTKINTTNDATQTKRILLQLPTAPEVAQARHNKRHPLLNPPSTPPPLCHHYQVNGEAEDCSSARWVRFARQSGKHLQTVTRQQVSRGSPGQRARTSPNALVHTHICREPTMAATLVERVDHAEDPLRTF